MEIDPLETAQQAIQGSPSQHDRKSEKLGTWVAIAVALLATFLGICKVKDDNIVQEMQQAQADKLDHWNFYQARNIREEIARATVVQLRLSAQSAPASLKASYEESIHFYEGTIEDQKQKKEQLKIQAQKDQELYDLLNYRDDQFDLSDTLIVLSISLLAIVVLTEKVWLFKLTAIPMLGGIIMGLAGLLGWHIHIDAFSKWLS